MRTLPALLIRPALQAACGPCMRMPAMDAGGLGGMHACMQALFTRLQASVNGNHRCIGSMPQLCSSGGSVLL